MQLKAGYFTNGIECLSESKVVKQKIRLLTESLSYFELDGNIEINNVSTDPAVALMYNLVSRGTPAYASQFIEDQLSTIIGKTLKRISSDGSITREIQKQDVKDLIFRALHIIDPRLEVVRPTGGNDKQILMYDFLFNCVSQYEGGFILQLAETGKKFGDIFRFSKKFRRRMDVWQADEKNAFLNEYADLCFSVPYSDNTVDSVVYRFAVIKNNDDSTDYINEERIKSMFQTINVDGNVIIKTGDSFEDKLSEIDGFVQNGYFDILRTNYNSPLYANEDGIEALQIALPPPAVARIQKTVLEAVNSGVLDINSKKWKVGVIERDVPCAFIAFEDLKQHFNKFFALENQGRKFPKVELDIFYTDEFEETDLNMLYQGYRENVSEFDKSEPYDLLIDISMLRRAGFESESIETAANKVAIIRSSKSPRTKTRLLFDNRIFYDININKEDPEDFDEQEDALKFFLKNIFAKNDFKQGQAEAVAQLLNGRNMLFVTPPAGGKSLVAMFAALMKPGYSFFLPPTLSVMRMQFDTLRSRNIDVDYYINPALQNTLDRNLAVEDVTQGRSLITFISPQLLHDPYIRNVFKRIDNQNIPIYYIMIDEAQRISGQTPEFRPFYQDIKRIIGQNFNDENIMSLRIGAFTSALEHNIKSEIAEKLEIDSTLVVSPEAKFLPVIKVHEITMERRGNTEDLQAFSRKLKQSVAESIIRQSKKTKSLIISELPPFDETTPDNEPTKVCGLDTDFYHGDIDETNREVTSSQAVGSQRAAKNFCNGGSSVLSGVKSAGTGLYIPNLDQIIYFEPPVSLEEFYRINGRAANCQKPNVDVLLNTAETEYESYEIVQDANGNLSKADNISVISFDLAANLERLAKMHPGAEKEKIVMDEILNGVSFPIKSPKETVEEAVFNEFNVRIEVETEPMVNPYQIFIYTNSKSKSLGYINFKTSELVMPESTFDVEIAEKIQTYIYELITDNTDNALEYLSQMEDETDSEENDGIQTAVDAVREGECAKIKVPFYNNAFFEASELIKNNLQVDVSGRDLLRCYDKTDNYDDFERAVSSDCGVFLKRLNDGAKPEMFGLYKKFRNKRDTLRTITRLKEIELIDDYLVNPAKDEIDVSLTKHSKDYYRSKLLLVLQRNLTKEKTLQYISSIEDGNFLVLEKYTNVLIDFFYSTVYPLYEKSAQDSAMFFEKILEKQKDGTLTNESINYNLQNYFKSKYKCKFVYNIPENPDTIDKIIDIISQTGSNVNELKHLEESVDQSNPENRTPANKIICGYCKLFTDEDTQEAHNNAYSLISEGLTDYRFKTGKEPSEFIDDTDKITERIIKENFDLKAEMESLLALQLQHSWLKKFNAEVLKI